MNDRQTLATINALLNKQRWAQANLLVGTLFQEIVRLISASLLCKEKTHCGHCQSCLLLNLNQHPDFLQVEAEKLHGAIKIEQIRALQSIVYTTPQLSSNRVILIASAEKMNKSAANALLKILEEPPSGVYFLLLAQHLSTVLPTIISRCQRWLLNTTHRSEQLLFEEYSADHPQAKLRSQLPAIIDAVNAIHQKKISACAVAAKWVEFEFYDLIRVLYLINAQMIYSYFNGPGAQDLAGTTLFDLAKRIKPIGLFMQLNKLNEIMKNLNHTLSINPLLTLEDLLLGYA